ncbi:hypothetical protein [Clostridium sp.]|nr:hypothetical protein [Clostridium sp.]
MIITVALMSSYKYNKNISDSEIEERARNLGMHYEDECKVFFKGDEISD